MAQQHCIQAVLQYIEEHLNESWSLEELASQFGYSDYHLHKLFTTCVHMPLHTYVTRRRISEAATRLVKSEDAIQTIAFDTGYQSQQAFHSAFKKWYLKSPAMYRKAKNLYRIQEPVTLLASSKMTTTYKIEIIERDEMLFCGYCGSTSKGFSVIGKCHQKLNKTMLHIPNRVQEGVYVGINAYTQSCVDTMQPAFQYFAGVEVTKHSDCKRVVYKQVPSSRYVCFTFVGNPKESLEPIAQDIYHNWFPYTTYRLNEQILMDIVFYHIQTDQQEDVEISYLVAIH